MIPTLIRHKDHWQGHFVAMASDCELLIDPCPQPLAQQLLEQACRIATGIEHKYSRYRRDNVWAQLHRSRGTKITLDPETTRLLHFAQTCFELSDGMFDITSGLLRQIWPFNADGAPPTQQQIDALLPRIGWQRVQLHGDQFLLPWGMELDFGGIGKEYAVDKTAAQMAQIAPELSVLVNFGGDIALSRPRAKPWQIGISPAGSEPALLQRLSIRHGALATSGSTQRFLLHNNIRYSHLLNANTGWATHGGPAQLTVAGRSCLQAGLLSSLALLHGADAEAFIQAQAVPYWLTP
ncbi:FAD:protein FMN transferase [Ferrimonas pelagia]|uniref:FAD:protein FMN transferase n=1 Tax=Ferrimonas pelagia TaxID=1177826 RepID=A0ABP9FCH1_9GAMM